MKKLLLIATALAGPASISTVSAGTLPDGFEHARTAKEARLPHAIPGIWCGLEGSYLKNDELGTPCQKWGSSPWIMTQTAATTIGIPIVDLPKCSSSTMDKFVRVHLGPTLPTA
jgi:hypothetical protein